MTLANKVTLGRLGLAFVTFSCLWLKREPFYLVALVLYLIATITDWVDGYIARSTKTVSSFGKMADPMADKVLVIGALIAFVRDPHILIPSWAVFLIIVRELMIGGLRALAALQGQLMAADRGGKWKMAVQSVAVIIIIAIAAARSHGVDVPEWTGGLPHHLVVLSMIVSVLSGAQYAYKSRHMLIKSWNAAPKGAK